MNKRVSRKRKHILLLGQKQTERDKTELTNRIARIDKTELNHLFETIYLLIFLTRQSHNRLSKQWNIYEQI